jgi:hypothetical protein
MQAVAAGRNLTVSKMLAAMLTTVAWMAGSRCNARTKQIVMMALAVTCAANQAIAKGCCHSGAGCAALTICATLPHAPAVAARHPAKAATR